MGWQWNDVLEEAFPEEGGYRIGGAVGKCDHVWRAALVRLTPGLMAPLEALWVIWEGCRLLGQVCRATLACVRSLVEEGA
jgi:hypothetical protein